VPQHFLLRSQQNEVFHAIQEAGLNPADFKWDEVQTEITQLGLGQDQMLVPFLVHTPTRSFFKFDFDANVAIGGHYAIFLPARQKPKDVVEVGDWSYMPGWVKTWGGYIKREFDVPNLWAELQRQGELVSGSLEIENTLFTREEQAQISQQLGELKEYVRATYELTQPQLQALGSRLDYLEDAARRLPRIDWRNALVGALLGLVLNAAIPPEPIRDALGSLLRGLSHMFGGLPKLPLGA
jgi:hypothetical protein